MRLQKVPFGSSSTSIGITLSASFKARNACRISARFADSRAKCRKTVGSRLCATSTRALWEENNMAELSHEQLWHVCQRKPGDYEPYGKRKRLKATTTLSDCSGGCKWYHSLIGPASLD